NAIPAVIAMELRGLGFDRAEHARQVEASQQELATAQQQYLDITGHPAPTTPNDIRAWIERILPPSQLKRWPRTPRTNELRTDGDVLQKLTRFPEARQLLAILAKQKFLSNFGRPLAALINPVTQRLHAHYNIAGAKTGRFSCSDPNLQQLPSKSAPAFK